MSDDAIRISPRSPAGGTVGSEAAPSATGGPVAHRTGPASPARRRIHLPVPSELLVLVAVALGVLIAAAVAENFDSGAAWSLVTVLAVGYMLARGLAKRGNADDGI